MSADAMGASDDAAAARTELGRLRTAGPAEAVHDLSPGFDDRVEEFVRLLLTANTRLNLTRITEPSAVARDHLLDALSVLPLLDEVAPRRAIDIGSGGGVPGIVLALARPDVRWTLVDSVRKKVDAVRSFVEALGLGNVTLVADRIEDVARRAGSRESFDVATARACAPLPVLAEYALPLVRIGGAVIAWKGPMTEAEVDGGRRAAGLLGAEVEVHRTGFDALGDRRFVLLRKRGRTPDGYPRRAGEPSRRPLA
ncbi:MAG: 16S rRNA (guanine(527)-N(7))-methyltransferase RsmG [Chloroflexi bacterium]|nr:16S rRNA (guanine(527)-N(7))-methyltransferase RsmG [Chloroflexota bacterium]